MDSDSYIIRAYRRRGPAAGDGQLAGVIENLDGKTRSFHSVNELWAILRRSRGAFGPAGDLDHPVHKK